MAGAMGRLVLRWKKNVLVLKLEDGKREWLNELFK
jgi:hypothetical protein